MSSREHVNINHLKEHISNLENMLQSGCSKCAPLQVENEKLGKENEELLNQLQTNPEHNSDNAELIEEINFLQQTNF